jgi:hypothetical protein
MADIYSLYEKEVEIDHPITRYKEFVWRVPIMNPVSPMPSLKDQYLDAVIGNNSIIDVPRYFTRIRLKVRSRYLGQDIHDHNNWSVQVWALANQYTQAPRDHLLGGLGFSILYKANSYDLWEQRIKDLILDFARPGH